MRLLSLELNNFRGFYGQHRVEFAAEDKRRVTIFHGENGAGKTNFLNAIHWCVTGKFTPRFQDRQLLVNKEAYREGARECTVELTFSDVAGGVSTTYRVRRSASNQAQTAFDVFRVIKGNSTTVPKGDSLLRSLLPDALASWFFFDAEAIGSLELSGSDQFKSELRKTLGFDLVDKLLADLDRVRTRRTGEVAKQSNDRNLQEIQAEIENVELVLPGHHAQRQLLDRKRVELVAEYERVRSELSKQPQAKPLEQRRLKLEFEIKRLKDEKVAATAGVAQTIGNASAPVLLEALTSRLEGQLNEQEVRGRLPSPYSDQLIKDILDAKTCICGRPVAEGSHESHQIAKLMEHATTGALNQRISQLRYFLIEVSSQAEKYPLQLQHARSRIADIDTELGRLEEEWAEVTKELRSIDQESIQRLERERVDVERKRDQANQELGSVNRIIELTERRKADAQARYEVAAKKLNVSAKLKRELDKTTRLIDHIRKTAGAQEKQALLILSQELNFVLGKYLTKHYQAKIDPSNYAVQLLDQEGRKVGHSTGEGQVLKFAFIATVVAMAAKKTTQKIQWLSEPTIAPLVLDAPFSALDPEYQGSVARNLATQATQLILMISSAAWSEAVAAPLEPLVGKRYLILSIEAGPRGDKPVKSVNIRGRNHVLNSYDGERSESMFEEIR
jgi:DNA sulfur modification protein DndD